MRLCLVPQFDPDVQAEDLLLPLHRVGQLSPSQRTGLQQSGVRQDYLDEVVWKEVLELLQEPTLIRQEIRRRIEQIQNSDPTKRRQEALSRELARVCKGMRKLLDAYQEDLVQLEELRKRMPALRKREKALRRQLQSLEAADVEQEILLRLADGLEHFLTRLRQSADTMSVTERQQVLRLVVKEIHVGRSTIWINHSIPVTGPGRIGGSAEPSQTRSCLLRSGASSVRCWLICIYIQWMKRWSVPGK